MEEGRRKRRAVRFTAVRHCDEEEDEYGMCSCAYAIEEALGAEVEKRKHLVRILSQANVRHAADASFGAELVRDVLKQAKEPT